jgi:hypothetical protein
MCFERRVLGGPRQFEDCHADKQTRPRQDKARHKLRSDCPAMVGLSQHR